MQYTQPNEELNTSKIKAENSKVEQIRNNINILEGELIRLKDLIKSEKYTIEQLVKENNEVEKKNERLKNEESEYINKISQLSKELSEIEKEKKELLLFIKNEKDNLLEKEKSLEVSMSDFETRVKLFNTQKEDFVLERSRVLELTDKLNSKIEKLKEIIN
jgi:chromosome segregation ATPase